MSEARRGRGPVADIGPEIVEGLPNLCGHEAALRRARQRPPLKSDASFDGVRAACAVALHMHQPLIPAGGDHLQTAEIISNLKFMLDRPHIGDNHNAPVFLQCYRRMGEIVPRLLAEGARPRVLLDYSGTLLYGLRQMGAHDVFDALRPLATEPRLRPAVEWMGTAWGHAVAPSTPPQDFRLHVRAWLHHFAAIFGMDAACRVRGFSPPEMALPNHPDVAYEFVRTLREEGYEWVLVQEHTVERPENGEGPDRKHLPHRLICRDSNSRSVEIIAIVKTQGSDTKLVGQMQPWYEARSLTRWPLSGRDVPPLVTQIADGENGGVMMNEFPPKYAEVVREAARGDVPLMAVSEYLDALWAAGVSPAELPVLQPVHQKRVWDRLGDATGPEALAQAIEAARREDSRFHMEGGSWTGDISWVRGYENVLQPLQKVSALFHERIVARRTPTDDPGYRRALFLLLTAQTSCFRYWGQGTWTDYAIELCRRAQEAIGNVGS